jgi:hypothetical protein
MFGTSEVPETGLYRIVQRVAVLLGALGRIKTAIIRDSVILAVLQVAIATKNDTNWSVTLVHPCR